METVPVQLGVRQIRTSGKGSGSIEVTLPTELRDFVGLPCRVLLRDGRQPHILLQPDIQHALAAFARLWCAVVGSVLPHRDDLAAMPTEQFAFALHPRGGAGDRPLLGWSDGLALTRPPPHMALAVSRSLAAMGEALAPDLAIEPPLWRGFGMACGYLAVGVLPAAEAQEVCEVTAEMMRDQGRPGASFVAAMGDGMDGAFGEAFWRQATPVLRAVAALFRIWSDDADRLSTLRVAWRRGVSIEMNGG